MEENDLPDNEMEENSLDDLSGIPENEEILVPETEEVSELHRTTHLPGMYKSWFLDYASYVILERAVPEVLDGLKPVQRRILHSMY